MIGTGRPVDWMDFPIQDPPVNHHASVPPPRNGKKATGAFDALAQSASWADLVEPAGWTYVGSDRDGAELWLRPGDGVSSKYSARAFAHNIVVHSENAGLPSGAKRRLTKGRLFAHLHHDGDPVEAGRDLVAAAHGTGGTDAARALPIRALEAIKAVTHAPKPEPDANASPEPDGGRIGSWSAFDLTPYINGTVARPEPTVGAYRSDRLRFFYPGLEHAVIGETEGGKTWFLLASAAAELLAGNRVAYLHFEENDPSSTVSRLLRQFKVAPQRLLDDFLFFGPEHPVYPGRIDELCAERVPTLVVLDGQNEAMALHAQKINDPDGSADYRRKLVKPWTRHGAAVASADHVVKDPNSNGSGYALGSVHKLNGLSGAAFLIENRESFGEGMKGNSGVYVTKDRPGLLRKAGKATKVARKFHLAEMSIDDTGDHWKFDLYAPHRDEVDDPAFEEAAANRENRRVDDEVLEAVKQLISDGLGASVNRVKAKVNKRQAAVAESLVRLEVTKRLKLTKEGQAKFYSLPTTTGSQDQK